MILATFHSSGRNYECKNLQCVPHINSILVTWKTNHPCLSRVRVGQKIYEDDTKGEVTSHNILLSSLQPDRKYSIAVVLPDGSSPFSRKVSPIAFNPSIELAEKHFDGLKLSGNCCAHLSQLHLFAKGYPEMAVEIQQNGEQWWALIPFFPPNLNDLIFEYELPSDERGKSSIRNLLKREAQKLITQLNGLKPEKIVRDAVLSSTPNLDQVVVAVDGYYERMKRERLLAQKKGARLQPILQKRFDQTKALERKNRAKRIGKLFFASHLLPLQLRSRLHWQLQKIERIYFASRFSFAELNYDYQALAGQFHLSLTPLAGDCLETLIYRHPTDSLRIGLYQKMFGLDSNVPQKEFHFNVDNLAGIQKAELAIETKHPFDRVALQITLNGLDPIFVPDPRLLEANDNPNIGRSFIFQRVPVEAIKTGRNKLTLAVDSLYRQLIRNTVQVKSITLRLELIGS